MKLVEFFLIFSLSVTVAFGSRYDQVENTLASSLNALCAQYSSQEKIDTCEKEKEIFLESFRSEFKPAPKSDFSQVRAIESDIMDHLRPAYEEMRCVKNIRKVFDKHQWQYNGNETCAQLKAAKAVHESK
jgi:hypothetical protein